ncbi:DUF3823 domain-containing protein [Parafilimonas sp.]|uniref:DUF3823 domain-containing protein n=1 Tax=Parafilimonas sp. TaxID=1969739 RepID=UPI0039E3A6DB
MKIRSVIYGLITALLFTACTKYDNYTQPSMTFEGTLTDSVTGEGLQTEVGDNGVQFKMMDYSYSGSPTAWYFTCTQDGAYKNSLVPAGTYNVTPLGPFVPFVIVDDDGDTTKDASITIDIKGTVTQNFTVVPFLVVSWIGDPVVNDDSTITVQFKVERGTTDADFQQDCTDIYLFVNASSYNVGSNNYDSRYTVAVSDPNDVIGDTLTVTTPALPYAPATYYLRAGARIDYAVNGVNRYNYNEPIAVAVE